VAVVEEAKPASRSFTGTVAARAQSDMGFRVPGKVARRFVDTGDRVRRGQILMRIDATDLELAADAQDDAVDVARARAEQADEQADHYDDLRDSGKISDDEYDAIKAEKDAAEAAVDAAESQADIAQNSSEYTELVAESDGVVVETLAEPGQVVAAGQPVVRLATGGQREAVVQLPETLRPDLGSKVEASLFGKEDSADPATLRQLSDAADPVTRTFEARYVLIGELADAPLGSTVTVDIPDDDAGEEGEDGLRVPSGAVLDAGRGPGVWVIDGASTVRWRSVTIQRVDDESMYVTGDVSAGERVVALGAHLMRDGKRVRVGGPDADGREARP
jgi:RND family efflux transporter MFP subunit